MILFIKHINIEGPETLGEFFKCRGHEIKMIELGADELLPDNLNNIKAVISLGGPMNVYEEDKCPFLKEEVQFIQKIVSEEVPFLGVCLGSQLLAKACGAKVEKSLQKEIDFQGFSLRSRESKTLYLKG